MSEQRKPRLLWVGDAGCPSGFALATHKILETVSQHYDVTVLGLNYRGDPHPYRRTTENPNGYEIYAAQGEDYIGAWRIAWMCDTVQPDIIVLQNDGWNIAPYLSKLALTDHRHIPVVAVVAVDGKNFQGNWMSVLFKKDDSVAKTVDLAVFWTQFAMNEARLGGYEGPATVIPLGVDLETYHPMDKLEARERRLPQFMDEEKKHHRDDVFIIGNVNRNQPRKRLDLTIKYFSDWIYGNKPLELRNEGNRVIEDAWLYLHVAPTGDMGVDIQQLAVYYKVDRRMAVMTPPTWYGMTDAEMCETYNLFDVLISTAQGEGMGLPALEAMACGIPPILPDHSAYADWARDAAWLVKCSSTCINTVAPGLNVIGAVPDEQPFLMALNTLYQNKEGRKQNATAGLERVNQKRYRWSTIGEAYVSALAEVLTAEVHPEELRDMEITT